MRASFPCGVFEMFVQDSFVVAKAKGEVVVVKSHFVGFPFIFVRPR